MLKFDLQKVKIIYSTSWFFPSLFEIKIYLIQSKKSKLFHIYPNFPRSVYDVQANDLR